MHHGYVGSHLLALITNSDYKTSMLSIKWKNVAHYGTYLFFKLLRTHFFLWTQNMFYVGTYIDFIHRYDSILHRLESRIHNQPIMFPLLGLEAYSQ